MHTTGGNLFSLTLAIFFIVYSTPGTLNAQAPPSEAEAALAKTVAAKNYKEAATQARNIAGVYRDAKKADKALEFFNQSLTYAKKANDIPAQYRATMGLGETYGDLKKYGSAQDQFGAALKLARQQKDKARESESLIALAASYAANDKPKKAIEPVEQALALAIEQNDMPLRQKCYKLLAGYYKLTGNVVKSNEYLLQHNAIQEKEDSDRKLSELAKQNKKTKDLTERQMRQLQEHISQVESEKTATLSELKKQRARLQQTEDSLRVKGDSLRMIEAISQQRQLQIDLLNKDKELADVKIKEQHARLENEALARRSIIVGILMAAVLAAVLIINYRRKLRINKELHRQNENIKSSINYAKRIQEAMLSRKDLQQSLLADSFLLFKPRNVVSGDFYWFSELPNGHSDRSQHDLAFAAIDCTGHGVPGAFMSMIGINSLNGFINRGLTETNTLLDMLHGEIRSALRQEVTGNNDGMDAALCIYRKQRQVLEFSGAKNPLVYIQDNALHQIKGDIHSIGGSKSKPSLSFRKHIIAIDRPTIVYLFSDGYRDQFGGNDNAKFMGKRFHQLLLEIHKLPMEEQRDVLDKTIEAWKGTRTQTDDILVMGIKLGYPS
jgi:serine phosphatase RsbU (regulator of sigma subunit)